MTQRSRNFLFTGPFSNGQRPDENDFNDVWESYINYQDDPINLDANNNYVFANGIQVGNSTGEVEGTIRFVGGVFQFRQSGNWDGLGSGGGGAFVEVGGGPHVAFNAGNVGINTGSTPSDYRLFVALGSNSSDILVVDNRVRIGNAAIYNPTSGDPNRFAYFSHHNNASSSNFALRQEFDGDVNINAPTGQVIRFSHNSNTVRMQITSAGDLEVNGAIINTALTNALDSLDLRLTTIGG